MNSLFNDLEQQKIVSVFVSFFFAFDKCHILSITVLVS